jgi:hypothetical protein
VIAGLLLSGLVGAACSLTGEELQPEQVVSDLGSEPSGSAGASGDPDAGGGAEPSQPQAGQGGCSSTEIGGCDVPLDGPPACSDGSECASGRCEAGRCASASCDDDARNQGESDVDCGGPCPGCPDGNDCSVEADCASGYCSAGRLCTASACDDGEANQDESDVDCGGTCGSNCVAGESCGSNDDCQSGSCGSAGCGECVARCCKAPICDDGVQNGGEPVTDCGNAACGLCPPGSPCGEDAHCESDDCGPGGLCLQRDCEDGQQGGDESDVDCGGSDPTCRRCNLGEDCNGGADCQSGSCLGGVCADCGDGIENGTESDVDCGGLCGNCAPGLDCVVDGDCQSDACEDGRCCGGLERDCTRCAERLSSRVNDLTCEDTADPNASGSCRAFLACLADNEVCTARYAPGCSDNPGGVCSSAFFGGDAAPGVVLADSILGNASCFF